MLEQTLKGRLPRTEITGPDYRRAGQTLTFNSDKVQKRRCIMQDSLESPAAAGAGRTFEPQTRSKRHVEKVIARVLSKMHSDVPDNSLAHQDSGGNNGNPEDTR